MRQKLAKIFSFEEKRRSQLTFSDASKIRLNPSTGRLELKVQSHDPVSGDAVYPLDTDLTVTTWVTNPTSLIAWAGFSTTPRSGSLPDGTSARFKLNDGTNNRYWNGLTWAVAGAANWNDEVTIAGHIASFPATSQRLGLVINLLTTDATVTPYLDAVCLLMDCEVDYLRSILADSVIPSLRSTIRPTVDLTIRAEGGTLVDLRDLETRFNVLSVSGAYDHEADPQHQTNLLASFDGASKTITLSAPVERGRRVWIVLLVEPEVYFEWGSQDFVEVAKLPAIVLENFELMGNTIAAIQRVDNAANLTASIRRDPFRLSLNFDVVLVAEKNRTLLSMLDGAFLHAATVTQLPWPAVDEVIDLASDAEGLFRPRPSLKDEHTVRFTMLLRDIYLWLESEETIPLIQRVNLTLTSVQSKGGPLWTGVKTDPQYPNDC